MFDVPVGPRGRQGQVVEDRLEPAAERPLRHVRGPVGGGNAREPLLNRCATHGSPNVSAPPRAWGFAGSGAGTGGESI